MPPLGCDLSRREAVYIGNRDVIHHDLSIVLLSPRLRVLVKPGIVALHEMLPLQDLECLLLRASAARDDRGRHARDQSGRSGCLKKSPP
jgi:hypothetical protein